MTNVPHTTHRERERGRERERSGRNCSVMMMRRRRRGRRDFKKGTPRLDRDKMLERPEAEGRIKQAIPCVSERDGKSCVLPVL